MAGNIKGITIELNGDTTKLDKALRSIVGALNGMNDSITPSVEAALLDAKESGDFTGPKGDKGEKEILENPEPRDLKEIQETQDLRVHFLHPQSIMKESYPGQIMGISRIRRV